MKIQVTLSPESFTKLYLITESTMFPEKEWIFWNLLPFFLKHQIVCKISQLSNLSKIPSHPITIKSLLSSIFKLVIVGWWIRTLGFPPNSKSLELISPKALETYN